MFLCETRPTYTFLEFFAGGGMARAGLGSHWECLFANDMDSQKVASYCDNWGKAEMHPGDVYEVKPTDLPAGTADLAWASFPCQDLSLAGSQAGIHGTRSGAFWGFWKQIQSLRKESRHPRLIVLENVTGAITSNGGSDLRLMLGALAKGGYRVGALVIDAIHFVPQSRPRLFVVGVRADQHVPPKLLLPNPVDLWTSGALALALKGGSATGRPDWISWRLPLPARRNLLLSDVVDDEPTDVRWHSHQETEALLSMMSEVNLNKVREAQLAGRKVVGTLYKRTRPDEQGIRRQRAEIRFDEVAGCLRTPGGGSSRQIIVVVNGSRVRSRLLSTREAARLMGLSEEYRLPANYNDAYHLMGDGVVVPIVRHLAEYLLEPLLRAPKVRLQGAA